jgi:hypothetical protein
MSWSGAIPTVREVIACPFVTSTATYALSVVAAVAALPVRSNEKTPPADISRENEVLAIDS